MADMACESSAVYLYRYFDKDGRLIYVGVSKRPSKRFDEHQAKDDWPNINSITIKRYESKDEALKAERLAIRNERPLHNKHHALRSTHNRKHGELAEMVARVIDYHGGLRRAADATGLDPGYLSRLRAGLKTGPSESTLDALGIERRCTFHLIPRRRA